MTTGRYLGRQGSAILLVLNMFFLILLSITLFYEVCISGYVCTVYLFKWIDIGNMFINVAFLFDAVTCSMLFIISIISFFVHFYSIEYMYGDVGFPRYMS